MKDRAFRCIRLVLYPNRMQEGFLDDSIEKLRYVYNACVHYLKHEFIRTGKVCSRFEMYTFCGELWRRNPWLHTIYNNCMFETAQRAVQAMKRCLENPKGGTGNGKRGKTGCRRFPRYRRKGMFNSFGYLSNRAFRVYDADGSGRMKRYVEMGKLPGRIRARNMQEMTGTPKTLRIKREDMGTHYVYTCSIAFELPEDYREDRMLLEYDGGIGVRRDVGIDLGLKNIAVFSDGTVYSNDRHYEKLLDRFRKLHERYSRSMGLDTERRNLSRLNHAYAKLKNLRNNLRTTIVNDALFNHRDVFIEDLSVKDLEAKASGRRMRRAYADAGLGDLADTLCRKSSETQHRVAKVNPAYTSALCSGCGKMVPKDLSVRIHRCAHCGLILDRDLNAAINILKRGLAGNPSP